MTEGDIWKSVIVKNFLEKELNNIVDIDDLIEFDKHNQGLLKQLKDKLETPNIISLSKRNIELIRSIDDDINITEKMKILEIATYFQLVGTVYLPDSFFNYYSCFHLIP